MKATLLATLISASWTTVYSTTTCNPGTTTISGRQCTIECGVDRPGGDYSRQKTDSFDACVQACAADLNCVTAQYHIDNGYCYFKKDVNPTRNDGNDYGVVCDRPPIATCDQPDGNTHGAGGCSQNCYCDSSAGVNFCTTNADCGRACSTDRDCPGGFCTTNRYFLGCGHKICEYTTDCTSTLQGRDAPAFSGRFNKQRELDDPRSRGPPH